MELPLDSAPLDDDAVRLLYRVLLGRAPETADTIKAFRAYYRDFAAGRQAILGSREFAQLHGTACAGGQVMDARSVLARTWLAGGPRQNVMPATRAGGTLYAGLRQMLACLLEGRPAQFALLAGEGAREWAADLLPLPPTAVALIADEGAGCLSLPEGGTAVVLPMAPDALRDWLAAHDLTPQLAVFMGEAGGQVAAAILDRLGGPCLVLRDAAAQAVLPALAGDAPGFVWMDWQVSCLGGWCLPVTYTPPASPARCDSRFAPSLALAAIMYNEARAIGHMLSSVLPIVKYVALADTGSQDGTIAAARAVLDRGGVDYCIMDIPRGRFDDMRNAVLDRVPPWVAWTLMLDADEAVRTEDHAPLLDLLREATADAIALPRYNFISPEGEGAVTPYPDRQVRLLRNGKSPPRYSGAVHETIRNVRIQFPPLDASSIGGGRGGPHIHHLVRHFRTPAEEHAKQAYYRDLARLET